MDTQRMADKIARDMVAANGPVYNALHRDWNRIHDVESKLEDAAHEYDVAASYNGKPAEKDAKEIMKAIESLKKALEDLSMKRFGKLVEMEQKFIKKYGTPDEYAEQVRAEIFPI